MTTAQKELAAFTTSVASAIAAGFVAFGHTSLAAPAQATFVAGAALVIALIHSKFLGGGGTPTAPATAA